MGYILEILHKLFDKIHMLCTYRILKMKYGKSVTFGNNVLWRKSLIVNVANGARVDIGDYCFFNNYCSLNSMEKIMIGHHTLFGENVKIYDHNHVFNKKNEYVVNQGFSTGKVIIGNNCWIGSNTVILKGSRIGNNCVIGAGCVISGEIPDGTIVKRKNNLIFESINFK